MVTMILSLKVFNEILKKFVKNQPKFEKKGFVSWKWGDEHDSSGGARRKYYKVNGAGAAALSEIQQYRAALAQRSAQGHTALVGI